MVDAWNVVDTNDATLEAKLTNQLTSSVPSVELLLEYIAHLLEKVVANTTT